MIQSSGLISDIPFGKKDALSHCSLEEPHLHCRRQYHQPLLDDPQISRGSR